jgi:hypothetical protein
LAAADSKIQIPNRAVAEGDDVGEPLRRLLETINILPTGADLKEASKPTRAFTGTPDSVAVIEAGATALAKWWSAGLGVAAAGLWASVVRFWEQYGELQNVMLWVAAVVSTALALAIGYVLASDIRGRAAATVATLQGRTQLAGAMIASAERQFRPDAGTSRGIVALPAPLKVHHIGVEGPEEANWTALAIAFESGKETEFYLVKGGQQGWVEGSKVRVT